MGYLLQVLPLPPSNQATTRQFLLSVPGCDVAVRPEKLATPLHDQELSLAHPSESGPVEERD